MEYVIAGLVALCTALAVALGWKRGKAVQVKKAAEVLAKVVASRKHARQAERDRELKRIEEQTREELGKAHRRGREDAERLIREARKWPEE